MPNNDILLSISIFIAFFLSLFIVSLIKKIYIRIRYKKRYFIIPHLSISGITNVAMIISISIAIIILLTVVTANIASVIFRVWPGTRVTLEGILIKIGGLLFGPFIGMFIGLSTDLLAVALTAGVFHYGYLIGAMLYGIIGGLIRVIFDWTRRSNFTIFTTGTIINSILCVFIFVYIYWFLGFKNYGVNFLGVDINLSSTAMGLLMSSIFIIGVACIIIFYFVVIKKQKKHDNQISLGGFKKPSININFLNFTQVLTTVLFCEGVVNVLMMPPFDAQLSSLTFKNWVSIRAILFVPSVILNFAIIFPIFKIVVPLIKYNYKDDLIEPLDNPLFVK